MLKVAHQVRIAVGGVQLKLVVGGAGAARVHPRLVPTVLIHLTHLNRVQEAVRVGAALLEVRHEIRPWWY